MAPAEVKMSDGFINHHRACDSSNLQASLDPNVLRIAKKNVLRLDKTLCGDRSLVKASFSGVHDGSPTNLNVFFLNKHYILLMKSRHPGHCSAAFRFLRVVFSNYFTHVF